MKRRWTKLFNFFFISQIEQDHLQTLETIAALKSRRKNLDMTKEKKKLCDIELSHWQMKRFSSSRKYFWLRLMFFFYFLLELLKFLRFSISDSIWWTATANWTWIFFLSRQYFFAQHFSLSFLSSLTQKSEKPRCCAGKIMNEKQRKKCQQSRKFRSRGRLCKSFER